MTKSMFEEVLGPLQTIIDKDRKERERTARQRRQRRVEENLEVVTLSDFKIDGLASEADFGQWVLATHQETGFGYTLKAVSKEKAAEGTGIRVMGNACTDRTHGRSRARSDAKSDAKLLRHRS